MARLMHVTPIWKATLEVGETANVQRSLEAVGRGHTQFLAPSGLNVNFYRDTFPSIPIRMIEAQHLRSVSDYNALMLSSAFYRDYQDHEFLVIVQTDAILFRELHDLDLTELDFLGAPWKVGFKYRRIANRLAVSVPGRRGRLFPPGHLVASLTGRTAWVGNGGLSIRRVSAFADICRELRNLVPRYLKSNLNEDVIFSTVGREKGLRIASTDFAGQVFREHVTLEEAMSMNLFGVHAPVPH